MSIFKTVFSFYILNSTYLLIYSTFQLYKLLTDRRWIDKKMLPLRKFSSSYNRQSWKYIFPTFEQNYVTIESLIFTLQPSRCNLTLQPWFQGCRVSLAARSCWFTSGPNNWSWEAFIDVSFPKIKELDDRVEVCA